MGLPLQWSIEEVCAQIVKKHTQVAAERNLKFRKHLLSTAELLQLIPGHVPAITLDPLAPNWVYNRRVKRKYFLGRKLPLPLDKKLHSPVCQNDRCSFGKTSMSILFETCSSRLLLRSASSSPRGLSCTLWLPNGRRIFLSASTAASPSTT